MISFKRHILLTTCLVLLLPYVGLTAEREHERYVPKVILELAKSRLEKQARAISGRANNTLEHVSVAGPKILRAVRMVGPIVDFEKAAGIKSKSMAMDAHDEHNHTFKVDDAGKKPETVDMQESTFEEVHSDVVREAHVGEPHSKGMKQPEMFKSVLDELLEKNVLGKSGVHGEVDSGHQEAENIDSTEEHAKEGHAKEGEKLDEDGHPIKHVVVFETVEVPFELGEPTREIRALQRLQDGLVTGKAGSFKQYRARLKTAAKTLKSVDVKAWDYKKNLDAIALFTLIGGDPRVGKLARSKTKLSKDHTLYLDAALAYSTGRLGRAFNLFKKIDFKHVPISTAAQFAIVKSMLFGRVDAKLAKDYLDIARKIAPGTLAEEASLRRLIRMSSDDENVKMFTRISTIYITRYKNSFYFNDFLKNYAYSLVRMHKSSEDAILKNLKYLYKSLKPNQQLAVSSYVSGIATELGMFKLSSWTAKTAIVLSRKNGKLHTRMKLYHLASTVTELGGIETMMSMVDGINDAHLNSKDKFLYDNVIALSQRIYNDPMTQVQIKNGIKMEVTRFSKADPTDKLLKESAEFAQKNATIKKSIDILAMSEKVLNGEIL